MSLLIVAFWIVVIAFGAGVLIRALPQFEMPDPFPLLVKGLIIIVALIAAYQLLNPYIPF